MEDLVLDRYPRIDFKNNKIKTEFTIDANEEISISINNSIILTSEDIYEVLNNEITLIDDVVLEEKDIVVVIYNKI